MKIHLEEKPVFFTCPPRGVEYPFLFVPMHRYKLLFRCRWAHAIVDSGVELFFFTRKMKDYPRSYLNSYKVMARNLSSFFGDRIWVSIPDYPDDYQPSLCWDGEMDNVDKTLRNIENFISIDGVNWLPVIQSRHENTFSFIESCYRVKEIIGNYPRVGIGTVCKARILRWIVWCCKYARNEFKDSWIHAFGLTLSAFRHVKNVLDSFDSMAWKFPRRRGRGTADTKEKQIEYFTAYLKRLEEIRR